MAAFGRPASAWAPVHILVREADLRDRPLSDGLPFIQASIGAEAGDLSGSVEKRDASIMIFQHPDRRLDEVIAVPACRDLQDEPVLSDRIVSPRDLLVVDAQEVLQIAHTGHESGSLPGGLDRPDPLKPQQGWQALLQCQERDAAHACACEPRAGVPSSSDRETEARSGPGVGTTKRRPARHRHAHDLFVDVFDLKVDITGAEYLGHRCGLRPVSCAGAHPHDAN